jgi:hypothetical protein
MSSKNINDLASKLSFYTPPADLLEQQKAASSAASSQQGQNSSGGIFSGMKSFFSSDSSASTADIPSAVQNDEESAGLMNWASSKLNSAKTSMDDISSTKERFTTFAILAAIGVVSMILAFTFLPIVIISPHKFALLFTLGSGLMLLSFSFLRGHANFIKHMASMERLPFSASYLTSLVGTLYCSLVMGSYLLTLIFSLIQVVALAYFLVSYIPGGTSALTFMGSMVGSGLKGLVSRG